MSFAVVIVSYRTPDLTRRAAQSALESAATRVIVVDNASADGTLDGLHSLEDARIDVVEVGTNGGFGRAANLGAGRTTEATLIFLNSDALLSGEACSLLAGAVGSRRGRTLAGPRLVDAEGAIQRSAGVRPAPLDLTIRFLGLHRLARIVAAMPVIGGVISRTSLSREYDTAALATEATDTSMVSGACFAIGRDAFWELGGFDERFFMYFEDADLCRRAEAAGMPIRYVPSAVVTHIGGASSDGDYHYSPLYARSMRQYLEKWWGPPGAVLAILLLWLRLVGHALVLHRGTGQAFAALRAALRPGEAAGR